MSIHTHDTPSVEQNLAVAAPSLTDWAVVAKVMKLDAERATTVGKAITEWFNDANTSGNKGQLLSVLHDSSRAKELTTFVYSLPPSIGPDPRAQKQVLEFGTSLTAAALADKAAEGLIVAIRMAHWRDLAETAENGEQTFHTDWDRLHGDTYNQAEGVVEKAGHGLPGLSH